MNETLRNLREQNNYSQAAVASFLGISRQMYIKYENGDVEPPVKIVMELANFYRVTYDVIIENKFKNENEDTSEKKISYQQTESNYREIAEPAVAYGPVSFSGDANNLDSTSFYLKTILEMLPKLVYKEQLKVLEKVSGMVQQATEERLKPAKQNSFYDNLINLNNKYHPKSNGEKWTREELYESVIYN